MLVNTLLAKVIGTQNERELKRLRPEVAEINALRQACNQPSSRDPVVDYDDRTVLDGLARLKERGLIRTVWAGAGSRVLKYHQRLEERLELPESASGQQLEP